MQNSNHVDVKLDNGRKVLLVGQDSFSELVVLAEAFSPNEFVTWKIRKTTTGYSAYSGYYFSKMSSAIENFKLRISL